MASPKNKIPAPKRMVCVGTHFGFVPDLFFPNQTGLNYSLPPLLSPLAKFKDQFTVLSGLDHGENATGGHRGVHAFLSGILSKNAKNFPEFNISLDQKAAQHVGKLTRFPSLQLSPRSDLTNRMSWNAHGSAIPPIESLNQTFDMLFKPFNQHQKQLKRKEIAAQTSILDLVRHDAKFLEKRVGFEDKQKLDEYFTSVREVEKRLEQSESWIDTPKPQVDYDLSMGADSADFVDRVPLFYDLIALALQTDLTRIVTFEIYDIGRNAGGLDISRGYHQLSHHGKVTEYINELSIIEKFHTQQFARFISKLDEIKESDGSSLLSHTQTLLGSGMGNANSHSNKNLPLLLVGGGFKHGQHLSFSSQNNSGNSIPAANLYVSMLQQFGIETDSFNLATGSLTQLRSS
ncbi:hypothetical protein C2869_01010 [Saccharobesus litoralis]|uniref:DUF1552 domain-containing protein n=2 Tax=Saccharobesus litoralis TaxID=2172099 RepID=A0A2S0VXB2_9ALTE|nr:hypothetical protein C2869_01010 [Saccharobesus litoralis]